MLLTCGALAQKRLTLLTICTALLVCIVLASQLYTWPPAARLSFASTANSHTGDASPSPREFPRVHLLLPASNKDVNLCKTALSALFLGYPTPVLIAWNQTFHENDMMAGGSHLAKISGVLGYLNLLDTSHDDDLVLMIDAYDIWFQLSLQVFLARYYRLNDEANRRQADRLGASAVSTESIEQTIIFAAGKRCAPNQVHTVACYPIPESPLPADLYGDNTDTIMGRNKYTSLRQRYLNSGYIIGPVKDMRRLFARAWELRQETPNSDPQDNGSGGSSFLYHGSDQSIFNTILGQQEYVREVLRLRHIGRLESVWNAIVRNGRNKPSHSHIEGTYIANILEPQFAHEKMPELDTDNAALTSEYEYGIGLDYFSDLGHQTVNSETDAQFLRYTDDLQEQLKRRNKFDCQPRFPTALPDGLGEEWRERNLYTHLCLGTIPAIIHHNGDKGLRERWWGKIWFQKQARSLFVDALASQRDIGAWTASGEFVEWETLCPSRMDKELYRDVD